MVEIEMGNSEKGERMKFRFDLKKYNENNFWPVGPRLILSSLKITDGLQRIFYSLNSGNQ